MFADVGHTDEAKKELLAIFDGMTTFDTPKPPRLIERILQIASDPDSVVLDSFAGSGTTAHAVLNMNKADGGHRRFILVEMMDYADSITAERVKRVIGGYGSGRQAVEGTGGSFSYYELGEPLMIGDVLNESVGVDKIREYVYFTDTKSRLPEAHADEPYYLGLHINNAYYFYYERETVTTLNREFLHTIKTKADAYVIYADLCTLHIEFRRLDEL
jgi:adenine-specific DNA-methyltransferase